MSKILKNIEAKISLTMEREAEKDAFFKSLKVLAQQVEKESKEDKAKDPQDVPSIPDKPANMPTRPVNDKIYIQKALAASDDYKQSTANGQQFLTFPFMRAYKLRVDGKKHGVEELIAFCWDVINEAVLKFMVEGAKRDMINGIISYSPNCILVKRYKGAI